jgi:hypothetical protein
MLLFGNKYNRFYNKKFYLQSLYDIIDIPGELFIKKAEI